MTDTTNDAPVDTGTPESADLGDAGKRAIAAERDARSRAEATAKELQAKLDKIEQDGLSELEKANRRAEEAESKLTASEQRIARLTVIAEKQIPAEYHDLVRGDTEEELASAAEKISALIAKAPRGPIIPGQGDTPGQAKPNTPAAAFAEWASEQDF